MIVALQWRGCQVGLCFGVDWVLLPLRRVRPDAHLLHAGRWRADVHRLLDATACVCGGAYVAAGPRTVRIRIQEGVDVELDIWLRHEVGFVKDARVIQVGNLGDLTGRVHYRHLVYDSDGLRVTEAADFTTEHRP